MRSFVVLCLSFLILGLSSGAVRANCASPSAPVGAIIFNETYNVFQGCVVGDQWMAFHPQQGGAPPTFADCTLDSQTVLHGASRLFYNTQEHADCASVSLLRHCTNGVMDGDPAYGYANCNAPAQDNTPDAFAFTDQSGIAVSTSVSSNILQISGITGNVSVSISGQGTPEYRICANSSCGSVLTNWTSGAATIQNNQYLQLKLTSNASPGTTNGATVTVGTVSDLWEVATVGQDNTPDAFSFSSATNQALDTQITSSSVAINGIGPNAVSVSVSGDGDPEIRINGTGSWVTSGTILNGQAVEVRLTSANAYSTSRSATVTVGTGSAAWQVTTLAQDTTPNSFAFTDQTGVAVNTPISSNILQISGITGSVNVSISGQGSPQYRICSNSSCGSVLTG